MPTSLASQLAAPLCLSGQTEGDARFGLGMHLETILVPALFLADLAVPFEPTET